MLREKVFPGREYVLVYFEKKEKEIVMSFVSFYESCTKYFPQFKEYT